MQQSAVAVTTRVGLKGAFDVDLPLNAATLNERLYDIGIWLIERHIPHQARILWEPLQHQSAAESMNDLSHCNKVGQIRRLDATAPQASKLAHGLQIPARHQHRLPEARIAVSSAFPSILRQERTLETRPEAVIWRVLWKHGVSPQNKCRGLELLVVVSAPPQPPVQSRTSSL
jgi:hypothetical protein